MKSSTPPNPRQLSVINVPCLISGDAHSFVPTADQRFLAHGATNFLRTHFPMTVQSRHIGRTSTWTEDELLMYLLDTSSAIGNRVMILYGAAGSGKSELLRWLQTQIQLTATNRAKVMVRISRTDLDILHIIQRFQHLLPVSTGKEATRTRWEECRQKPRTLAKILVLTSLEQLLQSDDHINALYYRLIDIVQTNLEHWFTAMSHPLVDVGQFIELFSREDLLTILQESVIPVPLEYEILRHTMLKTLQHHLLGGVSFSDLLRTAAFYIQETYHIRPVLFIDDLVQSINIFATDLLDYFITLEEGCWDVIIGMTPNSLETTLRGKELLERIQYLDTIDDRVHKLWLSDEYGVWSSFLHEDNCVEYARLYIREYKQTYSFPCNASCPSFAHCSQLEENRSENVLAPFNKEVLIRLFRSLPAGKGKARYFTLYLYEILRRISNGQDILSALQLFIKSEWAVHHPSARLAHIYELYGPFASGESDTCSDNSLESVFRFFRVPHEEIDVQPVAVPLLKRAATALQEYRTPDLLSEAGIDPAKETIKAWLQGEAVNKQLLRNLRRGVMKTIKGGYPIDCLTRLYTAKANRILRWAQTRFDTVPPLQIEDVDDFHGLPLLRTIGPLAYLLHDFADTVGRPEQDMRDVVMPDQALPYMMYYAAVYRQQTRKQLEEQLDMSIEELAFALFIFARFLGHKVVELPSRLEKMVGIEIHSPQRYPASLDALRPRLTLVQIGAIRRFFDDCFKLRENLYDGMLIESIVAEVSHDRAIALLLGTLPQRIEQDVRFNEQPLNEFLTEMQVILTSLVQLKEHPHVAPVLSSLLHIELGDDENPRQFANALSFSGNAQEDVRHFLKEATALELHDILILAHEIETIYYERGKLQLQATLRKIEGNQQFGQVGDRQSALKESFTSNEMALLIKFSQQGFRMPADEMRAPLLAKIARHFPDLYWQLEIRLQRE